MLQARSGGASAGSRNCSHGGGTYYMHAVIRSLLIANVRKLVMELMADLVVEVSILIVMVLNLRFR